MVLPQINLTEVYEILRPLALFVLAMSIYAVFIFKFYRFLASKDVIQLDLEKHNNSRLRAIRKMTSFVFYVFKYLVLFPVFAFFWFAVLVIMLSFMSENKAPENIFLVSMAVLGAIRIAAYYNEALSTDLSKILPFAMLGIFIIDRTFLSTIQESLSNLQGALARWDLMAYYLVVIVLLEFALRIVSFIVGTYLSLAKKAEARKAARRGAATIQEGEPVTVQE